MKLQNFLCFCASGHGCPDVMRVKQCDKPPMTGNGKHTAYKNCDLGDGLSLLYTHIIQLLHAHLGTNYKFHMAVIPDHWMF